MRSTRPSLLPHAQEWANEHLSQLGPSLVSLQAVHRASNASVQRSICEQTTRAFGRSAPSAIVKLKTIHAALFARSSGGARRRHKLMGQKSGRAVIGVRSSIKATDSSHTTRLGSRTDAQQRDESRGAPGRRDTPCPRLAVRSWWSLAQACALCSLSKHLRLPRTPTLAGWAGRVRFQGASPIRKAPVKKGITASRTRNPRDYAHIKVPPPPSLIAPHSTPRRQSMPSQLLWQCAVIGEHERVIASMNRLPYAIHP